MDIAPDPSLANVSIPPASPLLPGSVAPAWHTFVLVVAILAFSLQGARHFSDPHAHVHRLASYGLTVAMELTMLAWIIFGLRLKKIPFGSLLGSFAFNVRSFVVDLGVALLFWIGALTVLGTLAIVWTGVEVTLAHRWSSVAGGQPLAPGSSREDTLRSLTQLAPSNGEEVAAWAILCLVAGFAEEVAFRGYLQRQFIWLARGRVTAGVLLSALCFGAAHAYEGVRGMFLIFVFGVLFSLLALVRRSLRAGMIAHAWQDLLAGFALALLKSHRFI